MKLFEINDAYIVADDADDAQVIIKEHNIPGTLREIPDAEMVTFAGPGWDDIEEGKETPWEEKTAAEWVKILPRGLMPSD